MTNTRSRLVAALFAALLTLTTTVATAGPAAAQKQPSEKQWCC